MFLEVLNDLLSFKQCYDNIKKITGNQNPPVSRLT